MDASGEAINSLNNVMTTADWAFVISLISLLLAILSFLWNIWSKFIYPKPKVNVQLSKVISMDLDSDMKIEDADGALRLSVVNHGPGVLTVTSVIGQLHRKPIWKQPYHALLRTYGHWPFDQDSNHIGGFELPKKMDIGENLTQYLRPHENNYKEVVKFGISDSFGRNHWANPKSVRNAKRSLERESKNV